MLFPKDCSGDNQSTAESESLLWKRSLPSAPPVSHLRRPEPGRRYWRVPRAAARAQRAQLLRHCKGDLETAVYQGHFPRTDWKGDINEEMTTLAENICSVEANKNT